MLFGTAGVKILSSKDAKKCYTHTTAAVMRAKEAEEGKLPMTFTIDNSDD